MSFGWAFWINLVALRVLISLGQFLFGRTSGQFAVDWPILATAIAVLLHGPLFVWQVVGVLRSSERHIADGGAMAHVWGAQLGALVAFWIVLSDAWGAWHLVSPPPDPNAIASDKTAEPASYLLTHDPKTGLIVIDGPIALGVTKHLARVLEGSGRAEVVRLTSEGGNIYEGRGLRRLISDNELSTEVAGECKSACTLAFIGGKTRRLMPGAQLGFHRYRVDAGYEVPFSDPAAEQKRDRKLFLNAGVSKDFIDKMFLSPPTDIWFPSNDELRAAGVID